MSVLLFVFGVQGEILDVATAQSEYVVFATLDIKGVRVGVRRFVDMFPTERFAEIANQFSFAVVTCSTNGGHSVSEWLGLDLPNGKSEQKLFEYGRSKKASDLGWTIFGGTR